MKPWLKSRKNSTRCGIRSGKEVFAMQEQPTWADVYMQLLWMGAGSIVVAVSMLLFRYFQQNTLIGAEVSGPEEKKAYLRKHDVNTLIKILSLSRTDSLASYATEELGNRGDKLAVEPLIDALKNEKNRYLVISSAHALSKLKDESAIEPLFVTATSNAMCLRDKGVLLALLQALHVLGASRQSIVSLCLRCLESAARTKTYDIYNSISDFLHEPLVDPMGNFIYVKVYYGEPINPGAGHWEPTSYYNGSMSAMGGSEEWVSEEIRNWKWKKIRRSDKKDRFSVFHTEEQA
jgi:hypothetical protein